ncbi:YggS family pyridoxal phosphate-dependent enzyme [Candidatus Contubernalis alkalaceticus]|uniref:YggS family pyridoxal phosphate-dependent enzyme n=1 Tax=Candidatus Contubernalis alkaliaceticus TaxID=338645 RepID=UPI002961ECEB|nr:YggS family pyridoxal phosphate-dependent enzyme [Candidatus Contubernalis alkalaceticus]
MQDNLLKIVDKIKEAQVKSGRQEDTITLIAVTKGVAPEKIKEAVSIGINNFGENRVQEVIPKIEILPDKLTWHFIGHLQSNKVKEVLPRFSLIHSLDRLSLAKEIQIRSEKSSRITEALVQVNVAEEKSKFGLSVNEVEGFIEMVVEKFPNIKITGLMTIAPYVEDPQEVRTIFRELKNLSCKIKVPGVELKELSMGMSSDYEVAVEEGATMVRIGTALFG